MFDGLELGITWFHLHHTVARSETGSSESNDQNLWMALGQVT